MNTETVDQLIKKLKATADDPLSSKAEIVKAIDRIIRLPYMSPALNTDPLRDAVLEVLNGCTVDDDRCVYLNGQALSAKMICQALGRNCRQSLLTRVGKMLAHLGYTRIQRSRTQPIRYRAPKAIDE